MSALIQAVLFDLSGTLKRSRKRTASERQQTLAALSGLLGVQLAPEEWDRRLTERARDYKRWAEATLNELPEEDLWTKWMLPDLPEEIVRPAAVELHRLWRRARSEPEMLPQADVVVAELFRRGYRLGLISNTSGRTTAPDLLAEFGIKHLFESIVVSTEHGRRKPDPRPFEVALQSMEIRPEGCAYVGNRRDTDLEGARRAGFGMVVLLRRPETSGMDPRAEEAGPDRWIDGLEELLTIFPPRFRRGAAGPRGDGQLGKAKWKASISTMWGSQDFPRLDRFLRGAADLGFWGVELNHEVDSAMLAATDLGPYRFSSVHEPCPADVATRRMAALDWQLSSEDEHKRQQAVRMARRSIDLAREVGADVVVVHPGNVRGDGALEKELRALFDAGEIDSERARILRAEFVVHRGRLAGPRLEAALRSLSELLACARSEGIRLGIENRYHYLDIPTPDEMGKLLACGDAAELGMVYDVGHGQAMERLGFFTHDEWLGKFAERIIEVHLHDVRGIEDHMAPGLGEVDFAGLCARMPGEALRVCELRPTNSAAQVVAGMEHLVRLGCVEVL